MNHLIVFAAAVFGSVFLAAFVIQRRVEEARDVRRTLGVVSTASAVAPAQAPATARLLAPAIARIGRLVGRVTPAGFVARLRRDLDLAGNPAGWDAERLVSFKVLGAGALPALTIAVTRMAGAPAIRSTILAGLLGGLGFFVPDLVLASRIRARQDEIRVALPDALDLLSLTVEAGLAFDGALSRVGSQVGGELGKELLRVVREMQLGRGRADALRGLADRSTVEEVRSFVLAMVQADIFGIAIGRVLEVQAHEMRVKRRQRAEEKAQKVPVKIVFPLLVCIFPSLFVVLLGPSAITIWRTMFKT